MALIENALFDREGEIARKPIDKVAVALDMLKIYEPEEGYYVAYSGGKDSTVILDLVRRSGVKYDAHYNITTVDPPELVQFIRQQPDVICEPPEKSMRALIIETGMPPTRLIRYCCRYLKERGGAGRRTITGVRAAESVNRSKRRQVERCLKNGNKLFVHLIFHWSTDDVWEYVESRGLPYCSLYDEGKKRLGCMCCPKAGRESMLADAARWPYIKKMYISAFDEMLKRREKTGKTAHTWQTGEEVFDWWTSERKEPEHEGQQCFIFE